MIIVGDVVVVIMASPGGTPPPMVGVSVVTVGVIGEGIVAVMAPPHIRKVEAYLVGKVRDRCVIIVSWIKTPSSGSTGFISQCV